MIWLTGAFLISLVITALLGLFVVPLLKEIRFGQASGRRPKWHMSKQGTPTMGGLFS
jgi:phospho-N-acetylmuramoyl-pentapeptide-transferase